MADLDLLIDNNQADIVVEAGDLRLDEGLRTAVLVSLFTDARAGSEDDIPDGSDDRRGWWGESPDDPFGSLLWLNSRSKITAVTIEELRRRTSAALAWLVVEEIAERAAVEVARGGRTDVVISVGILRGSAARWRHLWDAVDAFEFSIPGARFVILPT